MVGALSTSLLRTVAPVTGHAISRHAALPQTRGLFVTAPLRRGSLVRLLSDGPDRTVVGKATALINDALSPVDVKVEVSGRVHTRSAGLAEASWNLYVSVVCAFAGCIR